jgi:glycosyltransferase involved in cell wall biosynthesis
MYFRETVRRLLNLLVKIQIPRSILFLIHRTPRVRSSLKRIYWKIVSIQRKIDDSFSNSSQSTVASHSAGAESKKINEVWSRAFSGGTPWIVVATQDFPFWNRTGHFTRLHRITKILSQFDYRIAILPANDLDKSRRYFSVTNEEMAAYKKGMLEEEISVIPPHLHAEFLFRESSSIECFWLYGQLPAAQFLSRFQGKFPIKKVILDTIDLEYRRAEQEGDFALGDQKRIQLGALVKYSDVALFISQEEFDFFRRDFKMDEMVDTEFAVLSNIYPLNRQRNLLKMGEAKDRYDGIFVGTFLHEPNRRAVRWLLESILPRVRGGRFVIVGEGLSADILRLISQLCEANPALYIEYLGHVPDLRDTYLASRFSIAPLQYGAGVKGKVVEALSYGLPVIGTQIAFEGVGEADGVMLIGAENAEDFAREIDELVNITNPRARLEFFERAETLLSKFSSQEATWKIARFLDS